MNLILIGESVEELCKAGGDLVTILGLVKTALTIIQIAVPILLIVMGSIDLMKAVMAGKEDEIKKAQTTFMKRCIAAVIVFLVPLIVSMLIGLIPVGTTSGGEKVDYKTCWDNA